MIGRLSQVQLLPDASAALLTEQYLSLRRQIPLLYALLLSNVLFLSAVTIGQVPAVLSPGVPMLLSVLVVIRVIIWYLRQKRAAAPGTIQRYLRTTIVFAGVLSVGFGGWGLLMFHYVAPERSFAVALYIFVGSIGTCYCLQSLPRAAYLVLLFGTCPVTLRLLFSDSLYEVGLGTNFALVALLIAGTLSSSYARFNELLRSRSEILAEQERARYAEQTAQELAYRDPLTNLPNRRALNEQLGSLHAADAASHPLALMILDLDLFKSVNDVHGHVAGDRLLQAVARRLEHLVAGSGIAYRLGGDEFAVTVELGDSEDVARRLAARVVQELSAPFSVEGLSHFIGASVGLSFFPGDATDLSALLRRADIALYRAKAIGRSQFVTFEPEMDDAITRRSVLERELRDDLVGDSFQPYFQPIVDLASGQISGFEMLARWIRADGAVIGPDQFIPIAEERGLVDMLMMKLFERTCAIAAYWPSHLIISVNVSPVQLKDPSFGDKVLALLARTRFPPERLAIEITENAIIAEPVNARRAVTTLKDRGTLLVLDDFGTGFSSLQHLRMLPFDKLKIDKSYVAGMETDPDAHKMVCAIVELTSILGLGVVAEGIETSEALEALRALRCTEGQGYLFGKPTDAAGAQALLTSELVAGLPAAP